MRLGPTPFVLALASATGIILAVWATPVRGADATWIGPAGGSWNDPGNWSGGAVPNNGNPPGTRYDVFIDAGQPADADVFAPPGSSFTIDNLAVTAGDRLTLDGAALALVGDGAVGALTSAGTIRVGTGASGGTLAFDNAAFTLGGGGTILLPGATSRLGGNGSLTITNQTIRGRGEIGADTLFVTNTGTIAADVAGGATLLINAPPAGMVNTGRLLARNGAQLHVFDGAVFNTGTIEAQAGSTVLLEHATLIGGMLTTSGDGQIRTYPTRGSTFSGGVTNAGHLVIASFSELFVSDRLTNTGTITIQPTGTNDFQLFGGTVTLDGGGVLEMQHTLARVISAQGGTLVTNNHIRGVGSLGQNTISVHSSGTLEAMRFGEHHTLTVSPAFGGGFFNTGVMRVLPDARMRLHGFGSSSINTAQGALQVRAGGTLETANSVRLTAGSIELDGHWDAWGGTITTGNVFGAGTIVHTGGITRVRHFRVGGASVSGGTLTVTAGGGTTGTSRVTTLEVSGTGRLDLTDHDLVIDYADAAPSPIGDIRADLHGGYNAGSWNGAGIITSSGTASGRAIGYGESDVIFNSFPATFSGQTVDASALLLMFTRFGDANLSGTVDLDDFNRLAANFGGTNRFWTDGDFNYDGNVNLDDFNLLAGNFGQSAGGTDVTPEDWAALASAVPEPGGAIALVGAVASAALLRSARRRRRLTAA